MDCKICRREGNPCDDNCIYRLFPVPQGEDEFSDLQVVDTILGRDNFLRLLQGLDGEHATEAMYAIIWEARKRWQDPIGGSYQAFLDLERNRREASPAESASESASDVPCTAQEGMVINVRGDYHREGYDIHLMAKLSVSQALLGGMAEISTPQGPVRVEIEPCSKEELILKGKGAKHGSTFGDMHVRFTVYLPAKLTDRQRELMKKFAEEEKLE